MTARNPGEHRDPLAGTVTPLGEDRRPPAGPIAVLPTSVTGSARDALEAAVRDAGGQVAELSSDTAGIVWLGGPASDLENILSEHSAIGWVQFPMAGVEPYAPLFERFAGADLPVFTSAKGSFAEPVAEHAVALTLAVLRQIPEKSSATSWAEVKQGISLYGRNVLIVGAGGIAHEVMRLIAPYEPRITIVRRSAGDVAGAERTVTSDQLDEVLPDADVVILAAAATASTSRLLSAERIAALKPTAAIVNIARGSLIDTDALIAALESGHLWGAGLDVTDPEPLPDGHPLWSAPRTVVTSHCADTPEMVEPLLALRVRENVAALLAGDGRFVGVVDAGSGY